MTTASTTINIRIDQETKNQAKEILEEIGLDLSSGIKLFLKTVNRVKAIPFELRTVNGYTRAFENEIVKEAEWALKHGKSYKSVDKLFDDILKD